MATTQTSSEQEIGMTLFGQQAEGGGDQAGSHAAESLAGDSTNVGEAGNQEQPANAGEAGNQKLPPEGSSGQAGKSNLAVEALASTKAAIKLYSSITGFDSQSDQQRAVVRDLMEKQRVAMERKLSGVKVEEGEDFDTISKQLKKENNKLDTLLEGKEALFGKTCVAAEEAIKILNAIIAEVKTMEEAG